MAEAPPGVEAAAAVAAVAVAVTATAAAAAAAAADVTNWNLQELQGKLRDIGFPAQGVRDELIERLQNYSLQAGVVLNRPLREDDGDKSHPRPSLPTQMGVMQRPQGMGSLGMPRVPGLNFPLGMGSTGLSEEERLKLAQQQAAILIQQEERAKQGGERTYQEQMKDQELLEQQKRAAVLMEQERQKEMVHLHQSPRLPLVRGSEGQRGLMGPRGLLGLGGQGMGMIRPALGLHPSPGLGPRVRVPPPPPGEESREADDSGPGPRIPQVLEKILQLKEQRQVEQITVPEATDDPEGGAGVTLTPGDTEDEELLSALSKREKNRKCRNRKKKKKKKKGGAHKPGASPEGEGKGRPEGGEGEKEGEKEGGPGEEIEVDYIPEEMEIFDTNFIYFKKIFEAFRLTDEVKKDKDKEPDKAEKPEGGGVPDNKKSLEADLRGGSSDDDNQGDSDDDAERKDDTPKMSKKKMRRLNRLSVAELKQLVARPDVVEMHDVTAHDPKLLVHLKATRNSVPVPRHWCFKRKYLQGKRGIEKPPFELPEFIRRTGIQEMREALQEKEEQKTMKTKMREKVRPKMGKIDIDYQKLHDAFFKWQTKPKLTIHGDLYYEGKEFETRLKEKKPGDLSDELRLALGMPVGANAHKVPPPWLIAMQRYGPPPSYPNLKIPGLNSPIPESCSFGYHAGGWGKPPVDETGKPLYGDVFGTNSLEFQAKNEEEELDRTPWGELEPSDEESSEEEEEEEDSDEDKPDDTGFITPADSGLITPGGFSSVPAGMETPELIELRKKKIEEAMDGGETPQLYIPVPEKRTATVGGAMMGSTHIYDMASVLGRKAAVTEPQGVEVALAPEELELDPTAMTQKYEERVREQQALVEKEDFSDMVAEHAAKQKQKKRKSQPQDTGRGTKKYKEFKF